MSLVRFGIACLVTLSLNTAIHAGEDHPKPKKGPKSGDTLKRLNAEAKVKKEIKTLPQVVDDAFHHDKHFGHDGIKAIYTVGEHLYWVEVTEGGKDYLLEFDDKGTLQAIAWEDPKGALVILTEGEDGYLWAVDEEGNAVVFH